MKVIDLVTGLLVTCAVFGAAAFGGFLFYVLAVCAAFGVLALVYK